MWEPHLAHVGCGMPCWSQRGAGAPSRLGKFFEPGAARIMHSQVQACPALCQDLSSHHYIFGLTGESVK